MFERRDNSVAFRVYNLYIPVGVAALSRKLPLNPDLESKLDTSNNQTLAQSLNHSNHFQCRGYANAKWKTHFFTLRTSAENKLVLV